MTCLWTSVLERRALSGGRSIVPRRWMQGHLEESILWQDYWYILRAKELSDGFVGVAEASDLLPVAMNFGFRIECVLNCVCVNKSDFPQLSAVACVFTWNEQLASHQACTRASIMACCQCQDTIKICNYCNQSVPLILSFLDIAWSKTEVTELSLWYTTELWHNLLYLSAPRAQKLFHVLILSKDTLASVLYVQFFWFLF